ncbi:glycosyltransferase family 2 protein [Paenibacillus gansuensis]|uniref:Glycosyltransferase family 2 protein n=1 Tax=Paenibacillus gansuensis TaxID=306542 RepID=A0ABW5PAY6_9BACL
MISIIACTMRSSQMENLFQNYERQDWKNKEMIVILNRDDMSLSTWRDRAKRSTNVRVYKLPEQYVLGKCLNWAIRKARGSAIAKFDDDDYYAPQYVRESIYALRSRKAPIVGKHTCFVYFEESNALMEYRGGKENALLRKVKGGTLIFKKKVWNKVKFAEDRVAGSDARWLADCCRTGFKVYSVSKMNYVCIRRRDISTHTQKKPTSAYMASCKFLRHTRDYVPHITKKIE